MLARADGGKTTICHATGDGQLVPITVSARAVEAHVAHGDPVIDTDVDEDCQPLPAPTGTNGCFALQLDLAPLYLLADGSTVQDVGGRDVYDDASCTTASMQLVPNALLVWAVDATEATGLCVSRGDVVYGPEPTVTAGMFLCAVAP